MWRRLRSQGGPTGPGSVLYGPRRVRWDGEGESAGARLGRGNHFLDGLS